LGLLAVLLLGGAGLLVVSNAVQQSSATIGGPFRLIDGAGHPVTQADLRGRYALIYFGYTDCPDVCPTTLGQIASALDRLGPAVDRVLPVFITVDPARDTPAVMARYTAAISPRLLGLTGSPEAIANVEHAFHVTAQPATGGALDHSAVMYLMGPNGAFLAPIRADTPGPAIAATLSRYIS
jgi:protein SCO1/2